MCRLRKEQMSPERIGEHGEIFFRDLKLGVPEREYWSGCHFVDPEDYQKVTLNWPGKWDDGRKGLWVGWQDAVGTDPDYPRTEMVLWYGTRAVQSMHRKWLIFERT